MTNEERYAHLKALAAEMPNLGSRRSGRPQDPAALQWLGRLGALIEADGDLSDVVTVRSAPENLGTALHDLSMARLMNVLHRALATCELALPTSSRGAYIPVGNTFEAVAALRSILASVKTTILVVDAYMDGRVLTEFTPLAPEGIGVALLTDEAGVRPDVEPLARAWKSQWQARRPLDLRVTAPRMLHDRLVLGDPGDAWILTQSLKDFAARSRATIQKLDPELAAAKFAAYTDIWNASNDPLQ